MQMDPVTEAFIVKFFFGYLLVLLSVSALLVEATTSPVLGRWTLHCRFVIRRWLRLFGILSGSGSQQSESTNKAHPEATKPSSIRLIDSIPKSERWKTG